MNIYKKWLLTVNRTVEKEQSRKEKRKSRKVEKEKKETISYKAPTFYL